MPARRDDSPPGRDDSSSRRGDHPPRPERNPSREEGRSRQGGGRPDADDPSSAPDQRDDDGSIWRDPLRQFAHYSTAGIMFPVAVALGLWIGWLVDERFRTFPLFTIAGLALGFAAAIRNLLQTVASDTSDDIPDDEADG